MQITNIFKKLAIVAIATTMTVSVSAQYAGDKAIGGNLIVGTGGNYSHVGIGGKFLYNVTDPFRLAGEFDFFPKQDYWSWWDFSAYGHYLFPVSDKLMVYPSVGLGLVGYKFELDLGFLGKASDSGSEIAFSLGGGFDIELTSELTLNIELRYKFIEVGDKIGHRTNLAAGIVYKF